MREVGIAFTVEKSLRAHSEEYDSGRGRASDHDAADAMVSCGITLLAAEGFAIEVKGDDPTAASVEGAIWSVA